MKDAYAVEALGALAHEHRLAIYRLLVQQGPDGLSAGIIAARVGLSPSSLTFHVQSLKRTGLVTQTRNGRQINYAADFAVMTGLVEYLTKNCCGGKVSCVPACMPGSVGRAAVGRRRTA